MAHGNKVAGKTQRSFYLSHDVVEALRTAAFERRESQSEIVEKALRKEFGVVDRISVINPWTGVWRHIDRSEVTAERLEEMAHFMEDDIREALHRECPDDPAEFFSRYVERVGPERAGEVWFS